MKIINRVLAVSILAIFATGAVVYAATTPSMGASDPFGILSSTYTNTAPGTTIGGNLGYTTGPFVSPTVTGLTNALYPQAGIDQGSALIALNNQVCTFTFAPGAIDLAVDTTHGPIGVYTPGVYCITGAVSVGTAGITLTGNGTYIFRSTGALNTVANSAVSVSGGASACDVFWTPGAATTLGATSAFLGTIIDDAGITIGSTVTWIGRALAFNGTVSTDATTLTVPTCTPPVPPTPPAPAPPSSGGIYSTLPSIALTKTPSRFDVPFGSSSVVYTYEVTNPAKVNLSYVKLTDDKCSPVLLVSGDLNNNSILEITEKWTYTCTSVLTQTTTNVATVTGVGNGTIATAIAQNTVIVSGTSTAPTPTPTPSIPSVPTVLGASTSSVPSFPSAGFGPGENSDFWELFLSISIVGSLLLLSVPSPKKVFRK